MVLVKKIVNEIATLFSLKIVLLLAVSGLGVLYLSRGWLLEKDLNITSTSSQGTYRVTFQGRIKPLNPLPGESYVQEITMMAFKGTDLILRDDNFYRGGPYEPSFVEAYPIQEWLNDYTLRLGDNLSTQPFHDEITISNEARQDLRFVIVRYGKYERFLIFDLTSAKKLQLKASPQLDKEWPASSVTFTAYGADGSFNGTVGEVGRDKVGAGPLRLLVEIKRP